MALVVAVGFGAKRADIDGSEKVLIPDVNVTAEGSTGPEFKAQSSNMETDITKASGSVPETCDR